MMRTTVGIVSALVIVLLGAGAAYAPYHTTPAPPPTPSGQPGLAAAVAQARVAAAHAGYAGEAGTVSSAREHLGHTLVCIEGPKGKNVNAAWDNPCQGMGNGVLADLQRANAASTLMEKAKDADEAAVAGMKSTDPAQIKAAARQVATLMQQVAQGK